ncbi:MAG TPA: penicillin-insensitive murein endopeptidase [Polyangiales bacterium]|nr:penicillin-insensitive murein endopeptidase [Polyangiales bacterium]
MRLRTGVALLLFGLAGCSSSENSAPKAKPGFLPRAAAQEPALATTAAAATLPAAASSTGAHGNAAPDPTEELLGMAGSLTTSLGAPARGTLQGAVRLPDRGPGYSHNPKRPDAARYGTVELVQAIVRAAAVVERDLPGSSLTVNDIGLEHGGPIAQHGSHQNGRDADILFYVLDKAGKPIPSVGVPLDPKGQGIDFKDLAIASDDMPVKIDLPRTWRFMAALLEVAPGQVQRIFLVEHLRTLLVQEAERARAPKAIRQRFEEVTCQPGTPHDDHMHVRFFCSPEDMAAGCEDSVPLYPWRTAALNALGLQPIVASNKRTPEEREARAARTTSPEEAKQKAGRMHPKVVQFLAQREAWLKQPHPGRPYCK